MKRERKIETTSLRSQRQRAEDQRRKAIVEAGRKLWNPAFPAYHDVYVQVFM